ncbi:MAG: D-alanine--D-alanine ligase [Rickettsiales bacterium]
MKRRKSEVGKTISPKIENSNNKVHVAFVYGGMSSEREVSLMSSKSILQAIHNLGYKVTPIDMGTDIAVKLAEVKPDIVFNGLYGTHGEDGCLPGALEIMGLKYTHSNTLTSAIGFDKIFSANILIANDIKCPKRIIIHKNDNYISDPMSRPYVIKPISEGSSVGVEVIFKEDDFDIRNYQWEYGERMIVEEFISGIEVEVAIFNEKAVGAVEIEPLKRRFYDYKTKYTDGYALHHIPPRISVTAYKECLTISNKIASLLDCKTVSRIDFRYNPNEGENGEFYFLEANTHPGMTALSLVPEICAKAGITFEAIIDKLIKDGLK